MRRHLLPLILLFSILLAGVYFLLNTTWLLSSLIPSLAKTFLKTVELQSFDFERQTFNFPDTISLHQVKASLAYNNVTYDLKAAKISIFEVKKLMDVPHILKLSIEGLDVLEDRWQIRQADLKIFVTLSEKEFSSLEGSFHFASGIWPPYEIDNVDGRVKGNPHHGELSELAGSAYGGSWHGQLSWEYKPEARYTLYLEMKDIQTRELEKTNLALLAGCNGKLEGTLRLVADQERIPILDVNLSMPEGGTVNAKIAGHLLNRLSDVERQEALDQILQSQKQFSFDKANITIKNTTEQRATISFDIKNEQEQIRLQDAVKGLNIRKTAVAYFLPSKDE